MKIEPTHRIAAHAVAALLAFAPGAVADHHEKAKEMAAGKAEEAMAKAAAPAVSGLMSDVLKNLERTAGQLASLAEATPADKFSWAPNDEVRTVSEVYIHVVATNLLLPPALGAAPPENVPAGDDPFAIMAEMEQTITDKEAVIAKLNESFAYLAEALPTITDLDTETALFGFPASKRAYVLILLSHAHEHLGQSIAYARSIGVVPPWSQPPPAAEGGEGEGGDEEEGSEGKG